MDLTRRLAFSYYKDIAVIDESHNIYLVQHRETNKIYVKKILDVYNIDVYERLYKNHIIGTPRIIDYCEEDNQLTIIEEYISGCSLKEKIEKSDLTENDILNYMLDLCDILEALHSFRPPIIHRDIKPSNVMITDYNKAILLDFNAAKYFSSESSADTVLLGTQGYAAPEQYGFGASSPRTDIYSLGILLKEMLDSAHASYDYLNTIVSKCTQINPSARYNNIQELKQELSPHMKSARKNFFPQSLLKFLPPGYRTRTPWKILLSSTGYLFISWLCLSLEVENTYGAALWLERIFVLAMMLFIVFGCFNYMDVQRFIPLCRHRNRLVRYLGIVILDVSVLLCLLIILFLIEDIFFPV